MATSAEVDRWLADAQHPLERVMQRVREVILKADPRVTEYVKNRTVQFAYEGNLAAFVQLKDKHVTLMFYRGARIEGDFPHLEGDGPTARFMRFADLAEVRARAPELRKIVKAWCNMMAPAAPARRGAPGRGRSQ